MQSYPEPSPIEALVLSPLDEEKFEPDYFLIYANGGQMTLLMNGLQYYKYEVVEPVFPEKAPVRMRCPAVLPPESCHFACPVWVKEALDR